MYSVCDSKMWCFSMPKYITIYIYYICIHAYTKYTYAAHMHIHTHIHTHTNTHADIHAHAHIHTCTHVYMILEILNFKCIPRLTEKKT